MQAGLGGGKRTLKQIRTSAKENAKTSDEPDGSAYAAPALQKGFDILELLCRSEIALSQKDIAQRLGRSTSELYRMVNSSSIVAMCWCRRQVSRHHEAFRAAHVNPPTHRLLSEAVPVMQKLSSDLDESCHLTVYNQGKQIVVSKVDTPSGMGFSVRIGAELDVLVSASGRVLLAFQDRETRQCESKNLFEGVPTRRTSRSTQRSTPSRCGVRVDPERSGARTFCRQLPDTGLPATRNGRPVAPYAERIDQVQRKSTSAVEEGLGAAAQTLSARIGGTRAG